MISNHGETDEIVFPDPYDADFVADTPFETSAPYFLNPQTINPMTQCQILLYFFIGFENKPLH